jgi:hypothetical protein
VHAVKDVFKGQKKGFVMLLLWWVRGIEGYLVNSLIDTGHIPSLYSEVLTEEYDFPAVETVSVARWKFSTERLKCGTSGSRSS